MGTRRRCSDAAGAHTAAAAAKIKPFLEAGFSHVALVQVGGDQQQGFIEWASRELLPRLRRL